MLKTKVIVGSLVVGLLILCSSAEASLIVQGEDANILQNSTTANVGGQDCLKLGNSYGGFPVSAYYFIGPENVGDEAQVPESGWYTITLTSYDDTEVRTPRVRVLQGRLAEDTAWDSATVYYAPTPGTSGGQYATADVTDSLTYGDGSVAQFYFDATEQYTIRIGKYTSAQSTPYVDSFELSLVPEPATASLLLVGMGFSAIRRRRRS